MGSNPNCELLTAMKSNHYFSFGPEEHKSYGYKKLTYKNIYPSIDIVYTIEDNQRFHYSIILHKGAKVSDLKMRYHNAKAKLEENGKAIFIDGMIVPIYEFGLQCNKLNSTRDSLQCSYAYSDNYIAFRIPGYEIVNEDIEIDPWVSNLTTLTGLGIANQVGFDVDYDNNGNLYVYGGGDFVANLNNIKTKIASYNSAGGLDI